MGCGNSKNLRVRVPVLVDKNRRAPECRDEELLESAPNEISSSSSSSSDILDFSDLHELTDDDNDYQHHDCEAEDEVEKEEEITTIPHAEEEPEEEKSKNHDDHHHYYEAKEEEEVIKDGSRKEGNSTEENTAHDEEDQEEEKSEKSPSKDKTNTTDKGVGRKAEHKGKEKVGIDDEEIPIESPKHGDKHKKFLRHAKDTTEEEGNTQVNEELKRKKSSKRVTFSIDNEERRQETYRVAETEETRSVNEDENASERTAGEPERRTSSVDPNEFQASSSRGLHGRGQNTQTTQTSQLEDPNVLFGNYEELNEGHASDCENCYYDLTTEEGLTQTTYMFSDYNPSCYIM